MKQAQVTLFILLGLLLLFFVGFFVFFQQTVQKETYNLRESSKASINTVVQTCFDAVAEDALFIGGFQGGYIELKDRKEDISNRKIQYYYYFTDISPNWTYVSSLIEGYVQNNTIQCIQDNPLFEVYTISVDEEQARTTISSNENTDFTLFLPITIKTESSIETLASWTTSIPVSFEKMYAIAKEISALVALSDPLLCMSCIHNLAQSQGIIISINDFEERSDYFILYDPVARIDNAPFAFAFAVRTNDDFDPTALLAPERTLSLEAVSYNLSIGQETVINLVTRSFLEQVLSYYTQKQNYNLTFKDFSPLFDIDPVLGTITITPTRDDVGTHTALIKIEASDGEVEYTSIELVIR